MEEEISDVSNDVPMHDPPPKKRRFSQTSLSFASESSSNSASSSSCSSSPSSSSASSSSIVWVDHSQNSKFDSPMWKLGLFLSSEKKINGTYKVKCVICEQHHVVPAPAEQTWFWKIILDYFNFTAMCKFLLFHLWI